MCKSVGLTTNNCKKNIGNTLENEGPLTVNVINQPRHTTVKLVEDILSPAIPNIDLQLDQTNKDWSKEAVLPLTAQNTFDETFSFPPIETYKRPISDSSSSNPPISTNNLTSSSITTIKEKIIKKAKVRSR